MQIEMWHHAAHHEAVMVLWSSAEHPVVVVFILRAIFQPEGDVSLWNAAEVNVFRRVEEVRMQRWTRKEAPVLLSGERVQRRTSGITHLAGRLRIGSLSEGMTDAQNNC